MNQPPIAVPLICLGDAHDGIWNIDGKIGTDEKRREILDGYHLIENLGKVGGSQQRLDRVEALLWLSMSKRRLHNFTIGSMNELRGLWLTLTNIGRELSTTTFD